MFKSKGICVNCQKAKPKLNSVCCQKCLDKKLFNQRARIGLIGEHSLEEMLIHQNNKCAICQVFLLKPQIDHNHKTLKIRGLLCSSCNVGIGLLKDDPNIIKVALDYVSKSY